MPMVRANGININYEDRGQGEPLILMALCGNSTLKLTKNTSAVS